MSSRDRTERMRKCTGDGRRAKKRHDTRADAEAAKAILEDTAPAATFGAYECPYCAGWHVGRRNDDSVPYLVHWREVWNADDVAWFEYHCNESDDSEDAPAWHRSHQQVTVLSVEPGTEYEGTTFAERAEGGIPRCYRVRFSDGLEWSVFEDELLNSTDGYERPDPPRESNDGGEHDG